jgi:hypothetical protein
MSTGGQPPLASWKALATVAAVLAAIMAAVAGLGWWFALQENARLDSISPCAGGNGLSFGCPAEVGMTYTQLGHVTSVGANYSARILCTPDPPPPVYSNEITLRSYNLSTGSPIDVLNVSLTYANGSVMAYFHESGSVWTTATDVQLFEPSVLILTSSTNLSGERLLIGSTVGVTWDGVID